MKLFPISKAQPSNYSILATPSDTTIRVSLHTYTCSTLHIYT